VRYGRSSGNPADSRKALKVVKQYLDQGNERLDRRGALKLFQAVEGLIYALPGGEAQSM